MAVGSRPQDALESEIKQLVPEYHIIGDVKQPRKAQDAIREGFLTGLEIGGPGSK
jgi:hypothetical protein